ncbi:hypothetical protein PINS_up020394 [Pythium insidiosum]|nr:hypothetical protein PINS_up020394 [Pythium insidiosum]
MLLEFLEREGLLSGIEKPPVGYPGVAVADGGNAVLNFSTIYPNEPVTSMSVTEDLPRVLLRDEDVHWLQVIGEGWASPLKGFMREGVYLQSFAFQQRSV